MIGISACLGGALCRYDGQAKTVDSLKELVQQDTAIMVCPEVLGGLTVPREPAELVGGDGFDVWRGTAKVITVTGVDVTDAFKQGAILAYEKLKKQNITQLITKEKSPSCGRQVIYDGSFSGASKHGVGVATAYFLQQNLSVFSDEEWLAQQTT